MTKYEQYAQELLDWWLKNNFSDSQYHPFVCGALRVIMLDRNKSDMDKHMYYIAIVKAFDSHFKDKDV